jgi:hypothetical protein
VRRLSMVIKAEPARRALDNIQESPSGVDKILFFFVLRELKGHLGRPVVVRSKWRR